jgi:hypothetical protein
MSSITITSPVPVGVGIHNTIGMQFIARGDFITIVDPMKPKTEQGLGGGNPPACSLQKQSDGSKVADGTVFYTGTSWWARFGPLTTVDGTTQYQLVATLQGCQPFLDQQLYFDSNLSISFTPGTGTQFPLSFNVTGYYVRGYMVSCYLLNGTTTVAVGLVTPEQPQPGQWTAQFNLNAAQQNCSLVAEMRQQQPNESVAAIWIDGVSVGGSGPSATA